MAKLRQVTEPFINLAKTPKCMTVTFPSELNTAASRQRYFKTIPFSSLRQQSRRPKLQRPIQSAVVERVLERVPEERFENYPKTKNNVDDNYDDDATADVELRKVAVHSFVADLSVHARSSSGFTGQNNLRSPHLSV